jgi:hypothetical protein
VVIAAIYRQREAQIMGPRCLAGLIIPILKIAERILQQAFAILVRNKRKQKHTPAIKEKLCNTAL